MARMILKLSGEALAGEAGKGFDLATVEEVAAQVKKLSDGGDEIGIVIGGGNFWRGRTGTEIDRSRSDQIGMLVTVMNCLYVADVFKNAGMRTKVFTPFAVGSFTEPFSKEAVEALFSVGGIAFFAGGTGHPYFSTDTCVVLRAVEMEADRILLAKNVDGVYSADPSKDPSATRYDVISLDEVIEKGLQGMDLTASILAKENRMPMRIFALKEKDSIVKAATGAFNGTTIEV